MEKIVVAFLNGIRLGSVAVDCPGRPPDPPSAEDFQTAARGAMIASGALAEVDMAAAKFVVQD